MPDVPDGSENAVQQTLSQLKALAFEPGKTYLYSYANVFLQKKIIEKITGVPYNSFLSSQILLPCHVTEGSDAANHKAAMPFTKGNKQLATLYWQKAIETDPNNKNARGMLNSLDSK